MKVLLWETYDGTFYYLVLWDGKNTYWNEHMKPSPRYKNINKMKRGCKITKSRYAIIGDL